MTAAVVPAPRVGAQDARICVVPDGDEHPRWQDVVEFVEALGVVLDVWQWAVLRVSLLRREGFWAAFAVAVCAPRQNGKNGILEVRELIGPLVLGEKLLIHTAHLADTSKEAFRRLDDLIDANDWLSAQVKHIWRTNGHESIEFQDGRRIRFRTRTRGGGRGFSGSPVFFDEAMFLPEISMGAIMPVISAQPDPQVWYMGSAVDQSLMDDGVSFARVRERALAGEDDRLAYFEWSLDADDPEAVEDEVATDPEVWAAANPAFGIRISEQYVVAERRELAARTFAVERLGVGDWPDTTPGGASVIDMARWDSLADADSVLVDPVCFGFDVKPDRSAAAIVAAGLRADGLPCVEVVEHRPGTRWVAPRLRDLRDTHEPEKIMAATAGPAAALLPKLNELGVDVEPVTVSEFAQACGVLFDSIEESHLRHFGTLELRQAVGGAVTRPLGDAWAWSRKNSSVDISPLVAATLAFWGVETSMAVEPFVVFA